MSTVPVSAESLRNAAPEPLTAQEESTITTPADPWSTNRARSIAVGNFEQMASYRQTSGHDIRLQTAEELYAGYQPKKYWEGTRIPRASLGVPIAMDQIEALMPPIMGSLFPLRDNIDIQQNPGTTKEEAQAAFELVMSQLENENVRERARIAIKQGLIYGNGIMEIYWCYRKEQRRKIVTRWVPEKRMVFDPTIGQVVPVITGANRRVQMEVVDEVETNTPELKNVAPQDFYIDPNCESPDIQQARFCAVRQLVTVGELKSLRGQNGFTLPEDSILIAMARNKTTTAQDTLKGQGESYRFGSWQPQNDYSSDPDTFRLECIRYYTKDRVIWVLNRMWVAYNAPNTLGALPFVNAFYVDFPNRFYGLAVTDVVEGEQRLQQAVVNARIDELALLINAPWIKTRGVQLSSSSARMYPGKVIEAEKPKEDLIRAEWGNVTASAYMEVEASDRRAQKRTGVSDLSVLGTSSMGGNSANRTATGVGVQDKAASQRIRYQVENLESNFIEPLLKMCLKMNQLYISPQQVLELLGPDGQALQINADNVINADVKFRVRASDKMRNRMTLLQALPLIIQTYFNPSMMTMMAQQQGKTIDMKQWDRLLSDALQVTPMELWRDMQPQEMQQMMAMQMAPQMMKAQETEARMAAQKDIHQQKDDTEMLKMVAGMIPPEAVAGALGIEMPPEKKTVAKK